MLGKCVPFQRSLGFPLAVGRVLLFIEHVVWLIEHVLLTFMFPRHRSLGREAPKGSASLVLASKEATETECCMGQNTHSLRYKVITLFWCAMRPFMTAGMIKTEIY